MRKIFAVFFAVFIAAVSIVPAFADTNDSPTRPSEYTLEVIAKKGGIAFKKLDKTEEGQVYEIIAKAKKGYKFTHWNIKGSVDVLDGTEYDPTMKILLKSDVVATAYFEKEGEVNPSSSSSSYKPTPSQNDSPVSPKTGDGSPILAFAGIMLGVVAIAALGLKLGFSFTKK